MKSDSCVRWLLVIRKMRSNKLSGWLNWQTTVLFLMKKNLREFSQATDFAQFSSNLAEIIFWTKIHGNYQLDFSFKFISPMNFVANRPNKTLSFYLSYTQSLASWHKSCYQCLQLHFQHNQIKLPKWHCPAFCLVPSSLLAAIFPNTILFYKTCRPLLNSLW